MKEFKRYFSPSKINLFFKVLYKREDGYHEIYSLFQAINLFDVMDIRLSSKDNLIIKGDLSVNRDNLIFKAIELFRKRVNFKWGVEVILKKNIPIRSGLGGGSGNAATLLFALHQLTKKLDIEDLIEIGALIGSDVVFFFSSGSAICKGRGEIFENYPFKKRDFYIAKPDFGISTKEVYKNLKVKNKKDETFSNDLEETAFFIEPRLSKVKSALISSGFEKVVMSGSGSAFFCVGTPFKKIDGISFFKVETIKRNLNSWYN